MYYENFALFLTHIFIQSIDSRRYALVSDDTIVFMKEYDYSKFKFLNALNKNKLKKKT